MPRKILIDHEKCTGCYMCGQICSLVKTGTFNPGASRIRIVDWEESGVTVPILCQHCEEPVCIAACPEEAIKKDPQTGVVSIDQERCRVCSNCRKACPYGGAVYSAPEKKVFLCDLCEGEPACVSVCPTGALQFSEITEEAGTRRLKGLCTARDTLVKKEACK